MTAADVSDVATAFELLIEALAKAGDVNQKGADAFREGRYRDVETLLVRVRSLEQIIKKLSVLQEEWLREVRAEPESEQFASRDEGLALEMRYNGVQAKAVYLNKAVTLLEDSTIRRETHDSLSDALREMRRKYEDNGSVVHANSPEFLKVTKPIRFGSPSAAAQFVAGCSVSGNREWALQTTQLPLGEHLRRSLTQ
jgi:hypothetical protein